MKTTIVQERLCDVVTISFERDILKKIQFKSLGIEYAQKMHVEWILVEITFVFSDLFVLLNIKYYKVFYYVYISNYNLICLNDT